MDAEVQVVSEPRALASPRSTLWIFIYATPLAVRGGIYAWSIHRIMMLIVVLWCVQVRFLSL